MDYSLLVGIHTVTKKERRHARKVFQLRSRGIMSADDMPGVLATDTT